MEKEKKQQENTSNTEVVELAKKQVKAIKKIDIGVSVLLALLLSIIASSKATFFILSSFPTEDRLLEISVSILFLPKIALLLLSSILQSEDLAYSIGFSGGILLLPLWGIIFYLVTKLVKRLKPSANFIFRHIIQFIFTILLIIPILWHTPVGSQAISKNISQSGSNSFMDCLSGKKANTGIESRIEFDSDSCFRLSFGEYVEIRNIDKIDERLDLCSILSETERVAFPVSVFTINELTHQEYCIFILFDMVSANFNPYSANVKEYDEQAQYDLLKQRLDEIGLPETLLKYTDFKNKQLSFDEFKQKKNEAKLIYCKFVGKKFGSSKKEERCLEYVGSTKYITASVEGPTKLNTGEVINWDSGSTRKTDETVILGYGVKLSTDVKTSWVTTVAKSDMNPIELQFDYQFFSDINTKLTLHFDGKIIFTCPGIKGCFSKDKKTVTVTLPSIPNKNNYSVAFRLDTNYPGEGDVVVSDVRFGYFSE